MNYCTSITLSTCQKVFGTSRNTSKTSPWHKVRKWSFFVTHRRFIRIHKSSSSPWNFNWLNPLKFFFKSSLKITNQTSIHIFNIEVNHLYEENVLHLIAWHNCTTYTSLENWCFQTNPHTISNGGNRGKPIIKLQRLIVIIHHCQRKKLKRHG